MTETVKRLSGNTVNKTRRDAGAVARARWEGKEKPPPARASGAGGGANLVYTRTIIQAVNKGSNEKPLGIDSQARE